MAEDHITTITSPDGTTKSTTFVTDSARSGGGGTGGGWILGFVAVLALSFGIFYFTNISGSESAKDNAVAAAARDVGVAAQSVGDAAKDAADAVKRQ